MTQPERRHVRLTNGDVDVIVDVTTGAPTIVHWGAWLGDDVDLGSVAAALEPPRTHGVVDVVAPVSVVPEHGAGFTGRPGLLGRRGRGRAWAPRFSTASYVHDEVLTVEAVDEVASLSLVTTVALDDVLRIRTTVRNLGDRRYQLDALTTTLPVPGHATELLTLGGRWAHEFERHRVGWPRGAHSVENRRGRTSHSSPSLVFAGTPGFGEWTGEVWGLHLAWCGNHQLLAERLDDGRRYLQAGELLHPGEVVLEAGESYTTPEVVATYSSAGLTPATWGFHRSVRARGAIGGRTTAPTRARPVTLNTWEAVYFDHDADRLRALATAAAELGVERFVLDDGWFGGRRDDRRALGDWWVSPEAHPDGLGPLVEHVTGLGMEFGIWVEPEMVSPDSDLFRRHPEWALATDGYEPVLGRHQLVLDLARPDAFDHVLASLDALLRDHDVAFVKWDMNRDHVQASGADGAAGSHAQTLAVLRLLDELRSRHPDVEFESCAGGGGRVDHEILRRAERVWTSDCNDALDRQTIQRGASMLIPPEVMGCHIGPPTSHTTGRTHTLAFRAATAVFGHLGLEWDVTDLSEADSIALRSVIAWHRRHRGLLHGGDAVRFDTDGSSCAHGVYASDRSEAVVSYARLTSDGPAVPAPLLLPGLDDEASYRIAPVDLLGDGVDRTIRHAAPSRPGWFDRQDGDELVLTGRQLHRHGIQLPVMWPESAVLLHVIRVA